MSLPVPLESEEAKALVEYLRIKGYKFTHIPNETGHTPEARRRAIRMKREGTSKGFVDYLIIVNNQLIGIELKRLKGSVTSPEQKAWVEALNDAGVPAKVCKGFDEAKAFIDAWANGGPIEQYACPSWYDEGGRLIDCSCNKCPKKEEVF